MTGFWARVARWLESRLGVVRPGAEDTVCESCGGWERAPQVDDPDMEAVRSLAYHLVYDNMHFHEFAMAEPFQAEAYVQEKGNQLLALVGFPSNVRIYSPRDFGTDGDSPTPDSVSLRRPGEPT